MGFKEETEFLYVDDLYTSSNWRKTRQAFAICLAEIMGMFYIMTVGCTGYLTVLPVVGVSKLLVLDNFMVSLGWGMAYGSAYVCTSHVSGYFLNPVLSLVMMIIGHMSIYRMIMYMVCQFGGALIGALFLKATVSGIGVPDDFCAAEPPKTFPLLNAMLYEAYGTFLLALLFCAIYDPKTRNNFNFGCIKFGFSLVAENLALSKYSGCSLNPARSLAVAIVSMKFDTIWVYMAGPFLGGIVGAIYYQVFFHNSIKEPDAGGGEDEE